MLCPICHEQMKTKKSLSCNHTFCESCINIWLYDNNSCPSCREPQHTVFFIPHELKKLLIYNNTIIINQ